MKPRIVFDIDDTICTNFRKLGYDKCVPVNPVIEKINYLHDIMGCTIVLHTSRGMVSCNGDLDKIKAKNEVTLIEWLEKNDVHYDEIIWGKPIADLYVDDKGMNIAEFIEKPFEELHGGGSNKSLYRLGNIVKKDLGSLEATTKFKDWVEDNHGFCKYPKVISFLYDEVYMEFIEGSMAVNSLRLFTFEELCDTIESFKIRQYFKFDVEPHIEVLKKNFSENVQMNGLINKAIGFLKDNEEALKEHASFCHGDCTLGNIILGHDGMYFIDPQYDRRSSSYLLDFAKLRMSLNNYEYMFRLSNKENKFFLPLLDERLKRLGILDLVVGLNFMYVCRLYRYKSEEDKMKVVEFAERMWEDYERVLGWDKEGKR